MSSSTEKQKKDKGKEKPKRDYTRLKRTIINVGIFLLCAGILLAIRFFVPDRIDEVPEIERPPVNVEVTLVQPLTQLADSIFLPAVIEPRRIVIVAAEVAGQVKAIPADEGRLYETGTRIVELDKELLRAEFNRASARANLAEQNHRRIVNLHEGGVVTDRELDQAAADLAVARAELETARVRLERADVYTPISGTVNRILVEEGEYVQPGMPIAEIVDMRQALVVVRIPEMDVDFFEVGQPANVIATVRRQQKMLAGTITYISEIAEELTRATRLEITVPNEEGILRSGHIVRAELLRRMLTDVIMIPLETVIPLENKKAVFVVTDVEQRPVPPAEPEENAVDAEEPPVPVDPQTARFGIARLREVQLGIMRGRHVQVLSGLEEGELLITVGQRYTGPDHPVRIVEKQKQ